MAKATTIKGGKVRVLLGNTAIPVVFSAPCGFTQRSITFSKGLEEVNIPDCDDPDKVDWIGRDAVSLSISVNGEGVVAVQNLETWVEAWEGLNSVPVKIEIELPAKTLVWTGSMQIESLEIGANNGRTVTLTVSLQSDGEMVRTATVVP